MKCTEFESLNPLEQCIAKWYYREEGPHRYTIDSYTIMTYADGGGFSNSVIYLKCLECGHRKRIDDSKYTKTVLDKIIKAEEVFTDGGATFKG